MYCHACQLADDLTEENRVLLEELDVTDEAKWAEFVANLAEVEKLQASMKRCEFDFQVPALLQPLYQAFLRKLGWSNGDEIGERRGRIARFWLAVQGNFFFGKTYGRGNVKKGESVALINALQKRLAWLVDYGSVNAILSALKQVGIVCSERTHQSEVTREAENWRDHLCLKGDHHVLAWIDNFNALGFPSRFETRWRDDTATPGDWAPPSAGWMAHKVAVRCGCGVSGMCGAACACTQAQVTCAEARCCCPCNMLASIYGGHANKIQKWVDKVDTANGSRDLSVST